MIKTEHHTDTAKLLYAIAALVDAGFQFQACYRDGAWMLAWNEPMAVEPQPETSAA